MFVLKKNIKIISLLVGVWLLSLIIVSRSIYTDPSNLTLTSTVYMLIVTLMIAIFGYILRLSSKIDVLYERVSSIDNVVNKVVKYKVNGDSDE